MGAGGGGGGAGGAAGERTERAEGAARGAAEHDGDTDIAEQDHHCAEQGLRAHDGPDAGEVPQEARDPHAPLPLRQAKPQGLHLPASVRTRHRGLRAEPQRQLSLYAAAEEEEEEHPAAHDHGPGCVPLRW